MTKSELQQLVIDYADAYSIDRSVALAQAQKESAFREDIVYGPTVSSAGARGIMQFTAPAWADYGQGDFSNAFDPDYNLTAWGAYMQALLDRYGWDYRKALMAYYGGPGRVDKGAVTADIQNYADSILANAGNSQYRTISDSPGDDNSILGLSFTTALLIAGGLFAFVALRK